MYEFILRLFRANTADSSSIVSQKGAKSENSRQFLAINVDFSSARQSLSCYKWMDNKIPQHENGDLRKCKGSVKLIKCEIYASFTSALHHSKVMFSCCVPGLRQKFVYIKHMRLHDFLDLPIVELARSENTKREDRAGMIRWQSETGNEKQTTLRKCCLISLQV